MEFVPPEYRSHRLSGIDIWHHAGEGTGVVTNLAAVTVDLAAAMESELAHSLSCALHLCVYRTNAAATAALGRNVPTSLIVCQSPEVDPRNGDWQRMRRHLAHELAHVMLADMTGGTRMLGDGGRSIRVRAWFDEGFAEVAAAVVCARPDIIEHYLAVRRSRIGTKTNWTLPSTTSIRRDGRRHLPKRFAASGLPFEVTSSVHCYSKDPVGRITSVERPQDLCYTDV